MKIFKYTAAFSSQRQTRSNAYVLEFSPCGGSIWPKAAFWAPGQIQLTGPKAQSTARFLTCEWRRSPYQDHRACWTDGKHVLSCGPYSNAKTRALLRTFWWYQMFLTGFVQDALALKTQCVCQIDRQRVTIPKISVYESKNRKNAYLTGPEVHVHKSSE